MQPLLAEDRNCAIFGLWLYHTRIGFHNSPTVKLVRLEKTYHVASCKLEIKLKLKQKRKDEGMSH